MPDYRLYYLDSANRIQRAVDFERVGDSEAHYLAIERSDGPAMELWSGVRLVKEFPVNLQSSA